MLVNTANLENLLTKLNEICDKVDKMAVKLDRVEENQLKLTNLISRRRKKRKLRVEKRVPQNLGCVKTGKGFVKADFHESRKETLSRSTKNLWVSYKMYVYKWLQIPQNQSFFRQSRAHSYTHSINRGWERVKASYLIERLNEIAMKSFRQAVKDINPDVTRQDFLFEFPKAKFIILLKELHGSLKASKQASRYKPS